jgi:uncharacterized protein
MNFATLADLADRLLIYQGILATGPGQLWRELVKSGGNRVAYSNWLHSLADRQQGWQDYLFDRLLLDDNPFTRAVQQGGVPDILEQAALHDLELLRQIYNCNSHQLASLCDGFAWVDNICSTEPHVLRKKLAAPDWVALLPDLITHYRRCGTGLFGEFRSLHWRNGALQGIAVPDSVQLDDLAGYEWQRSALIKNTEALVAGYPALNVLLYGARGCGKSSLVKALVPEFAGRGLRLIEVSKQDAIDLPLILQQLQGLPQKFILFVDDLSFEADEAAFKALKVVLEGSSIGRPANLVVYATSNRRHLIREFFADRPRPQDSDEIHNWDTVQEKLSFSDRFGLTLTFEPADQQTYLQIVRHLAQDLEITAADLEFRALQWATQQNGRSGRTARQFVDFLRFSYKEALPTDLEFKEF